MKLNLTEKPEIIQSPPRSYLYLERIGSFMVQAPRAWQEFSEVVAPLKSRLPISVMAGLQ